VPSNLPQGLSASELPDNDVQIGCQPAASSIFRLLQTQEPGAMPGDNQLVRDDTPVRPRFDCGVVDVATTDLTEIRTIILDAQNPGDISGGFNFDADIADDGGASGAYYQVDPFPSANGSVAKMKRWMRLGLPTDSDTGPLNGQGGRMRCEPTPPDYFGTIDSGGTVRIAAEDYVRVDQAMLSASNFVVGCSEFIVEWSFGRLDQNGNQIWHGLARDLDLDSDGTGDLPVARPFPNAADNLLAAQRARGGMFNANVVTGLQGVRGELIHDPDGATVPGTLYSYFGYLDPSYVPPSGVSATRAWPWPKMIRITMSLTDPNDPTSEETFQFVVELPVERQQMQY
jgi:hypothetical protein